MGGKADGVLPSMSWDSVVDPDAPDGVAPGQAAPTNDTPPLTAAAEAPLIAPSHPAPDAAEPAFTLSLEAPGVDATPSSTPPPAAPAPIVSSQHAPITLGSSPESLSPPAPAEIKMPSLADHLGAPAAEPIAMSIPSPSEARDAVDAAARDQAAQDAAQAQAQAAADARAQEEAHAQAVVDAEAQAGAATQAAADAHAAAQAAADAQVQAEAQAQVQAAADAQVQAAAQAQAQAAADAQAAAQAQVLAASVSPVAPVAPKASASPLAIDPTQPSNRKAKKDRSKGLARVAFVILLVAALASVGIIFGKPYLVASPWDSDVLPYAESVEAVRGVDYVEPLTITEQPADAHRALVTEQLLGDVDGQLAMWRALGLAGPTGTDAETLTTLLEDVNPALYSYVDGQVYVDQSYGLGDRDARVMRAMAVASLDQSFAFSTLASPLDLDDRALVDAHIRQQVDRIQTASIEPFTVTAPTVAQFSFLPPVLDYRMTAPIVFSELLPEYNDVVTNPLANLVLTGPGPLVSEPLELLERDPLAATDVATTDALPMDRSFWFLVFATHLESSTAYEMSNTIEQTSLQMVTGTEGTCAVATFSGGNSNANAELTASLTRWADAAAVEMSATVESLPDSNAQLRTCDPSGTYQPTARFGVARQLLGWRAAELALVTSIVEQGGTMADAAAAMPAYAATPGVMAVVELPAGTAASDVADAARVAVAEFSILMQITADNAAAEADGADGAASSADGN